MVTDRIGDFIIRLQNAARIGKANVSMPYSSHVLAIAKKLKELGFIATVDVKAIGDSDVKKRLRQHSYLMNADNRNFAE